MLKLRRLQLYDRRLVILKNNKTENLTLRNETKESSIKSESHLKLYDNEIGNISCWCGSPYACWFGNFEGHIKWFGRDLILHTFSVTKQSLLFISFDTDKEILISIGRNHFLKGKLYANFFALSFMGPSKSVIDSLLLIKEIPLTLDRTFGDKDPSCFDLYSKNIDHYMIFGNMSGNLNLLKGHINKFQSMRIAFMKDYGSPVIGVYFLSYENTLILFVCTISSIYSYKIQSDGDLLINFVEDLPEKTLYNHTLNKSNNNLLILRIGAVFTYHPIEGNLSAIPFEGQCIKLLSHRNYFIAITKEILNNYDPISKIQQQESLSICLNLPEVRLLAFSGVFHSIKCTISAIESIFVLYSSSSDHENSLIIDQLYEKPISERMEILIRKRLFEWATTIALKENQPLSIIQGVHHLHADWLFKKGNFSQALTVYIKTIGYLDPSIIIEKYLTSQRIKDLSEYLLQLHNSGLALKEHTVMLFKCYTVLGESPKIEDFVLTQKFQNYDFRSVIGECRDSGYYRLALDMSKMQSQHDLFITILIEDFYDLDQAMNYMQSLSAPVACTLIMKFGRILIRKRPEKAILMIYDLLDNNNIGLEVFLPLFLDCDKLLNRFLSRYIQTSQEDSINLLNQTSKLISIGSTPILIFLELILRNWNYVTSSYDNDTIESNVTIESKMKHSQIQVSKNSNKLNPVNSNYEKDFILNILKNYITKDKDLKSALKLFLIYSFEPGLLYCCEKIGEFQIPLLYYIKNQEANNLNNYCNKNSVIDPVLWTQALTYATSLKNPDVQLKRVLEHILKKSLLPPLAVLNILENYKHIPSGSVQDYLLQSFIQQEEVLKAEQSKLFSTFQDLEFIKNEKNKLKNTVKSFSTSTCAQCHFPIELPSINFYCGHSYHIYCVTSESNCQKCEAMISSRKLMYQQRLFKTENIDEFFKQLRNSSNGLEHIFNYFGRGMFLS